MASQKSSSAFSNAQGRHDRLHGKTSQASSVLDFEYLIALSLQGNHLLFDLNTIRRAYQSSGEGVDFSGLTDEQAGKIEPLIERLVQEPTLRGKLHLLECATQEERESVLRAYFFMVESHLHAHPEVGH